MHTHTHTHTHKGNEKERGRERMLEDFAKFSDKAFMVNETFDLMGHDCKCRTCRVQ